MAGEHLVAESPDGVDVRSVIRPWIAGALLGRHVRDRAEYRAERASRLGIARRFGKGFRNTEIGDESVLPREQDVCWFDVAMNDPFVMGVRERVDDVAQDLNHLRHRELAAARKARTQRVSGDEGHDVERQPVHIPGGEHGHDVRMLEVRREPDLPAKTVHADRFHQLRR
jgi:hypothetical protein